VRAAATSREEIYIAAAASTLGADMKAWTQVGAYDISNYEAINHTLGLLRYEHWMSTVYIGARASRCRCAWRERSHHFSEMDPIFFAGFQWGIIFLTRVDTQYNHYS